MQKACGIQKTSVLTSISKMADLDSSIDELLMDSEDSPEEIIPKNNVELAEIKKENGNQLFKLKQYRSALRLYGEAIELCPDTAAYYGNRSACHIMMSHFEEALDDSRRCVQLDPTFLKGYARIIKCGINLGDTMAAEQAVKSYLNLEPTGKAIASELKSLEKMKQYQAEATKAYESKDFRKVVYCMDRCLDEAPSCAKYKINKAECLTFLGRTSEAGEIVNGILHVNKGNADAIFVRGVCLFYEDNIDSSVAHFQQVLRLAPDNQKAMEYYKKAKKLKQKKDEGNEAYKLNKFADAVKLYSEALEVDPFNKKTNAKLFCNRATAYSRLSKIREALDDCTKALNLDENYLKALLRRAKCNMDLGEYDDAVKDYEKACKMDKSKENKRLLQDAKLQLKKSKRKDYYKILGVERNANTDDIKKAYRKRALVHHPDRHASATEAEKKEQEKKFKELGEAYGVLSDSKKKAKYDSGQDLEDFDCGGVPEFDPSQVFQQFFTTGGGHAGHGMDFGGGGGFPGGFTFQFG